MAGAQTTEQPSVNHVALNRLVPRFRANLVFWVDASSCGFEDIVHLLLI